tara:strand:- start:347 stop:511 length:165 start_codon:yes stop_codon:yes gene_type:complete
MTVIILDENEAQVLTSVISALDRLYVGPLVAAMEGSGWPSLASLRAGLEADGDE